jgi:branched-chain amino acid transport system permease protein
VLNFAQGELGTFALFVTWWLIVRQGQPWAVGAAGGLAAAVVIALGFERLVVRRMAEASRLSVAVATVGLFGLLIALEATLFSESLLILRPPLRGLGPRVAGFYVSPTHMIALAAVAAIGVALAAFLRYTDFGLGVLAASEDPSTVRLMGVRLSRVSAFTWGISGAVGAIAAILIEPIIGAFSPGFMTQFFVRGLAAALVGGMTSLTGAFVGGVAVGLIEAIVGRFFVQAQVPGIGSVTILAVIVAVLLLRPGGVFSGPRARSA